MAKNTWRKIKESLAGQLPTHTISTWFDPISPIAIQGSELVLEVPNQFFYDWIESHYRNHINKSLDDLGKNNLTQDAIQYALDQNIEIYRTNITSAFEGFIYEAIKTDEILNNSYGKKDLDYCNIVGGGFHGRDGDIVVDNISNPNIIYGIAAGDGTLKNKLSTKDKEKLSKLKKEISK